MNSARQNGFAAQLLSRARGEVGQLRPKVQPYYAADTDEAEPMIEEVTREVPAKAPPGSPVDAVRTEPPAAPAPSELHDDTHLMPPQRETPATPPAPGPAPARVRREASPPTQPIFEAETSRPAEAPDAIPATQRPQMPSPEPKEVRPARQARIIQPDFAAVLAAAVARLSGEAPEPEPRLMPEQTAPSVAERVMRPAPDAPGDPGPRGGEETPPPLHIHIGEIVIEADPTPAAQTFEPPRPRPSWQPTLSLDAYRSARQRGER